VGIEQIMRDWSNDNDLDYSVQAISANGYVIFSHKKERPAKHTKMISKPIYQDGRLVLTLKLERDLTTVKSQSRDIQNNFIFIGASFALFFGFTIWFMLHRYAFTPLAREISRRQHAENALTQANENLERRVEERAAAVTRLSGVVEQTDDIVVIASPTGVVEYVNPAFERITGYTLQEIFGKPIGSIKSGLHDNAFYKDLWTTIQSGEPFREIFINRKKNGDLYYEEKTITPLRDKDGNINSFVSTGKDISERIEFQEKLQHMATHDALTGLPNKLMINDRLSHAIEQAERNQQKIAVLFLDLDRFKHINDSLGHSTGDSLLKTIGVKLEHCLRKGDTVGRFGGDEFTIIMEGTKDFNDINLVSQKILEKVSEPILIGGYEITTSASIGITVFPDDSDNVDSLLKSADVAMYRAKARGGNAFQFYTHDMSVRALERMELQNRLSHALERGELLLHYQPRISLETGQVTGMEALLRWDSPQFGLVGPDRFIPILEETGKIVEVGHWVIREACHFNASLAKRGLPSLRVSVNLSARQFHDDKLISLLEEICQGHSRDTQTLEIEITESLLVDNIDQAVKILRQLQELGIHVSIDDFGTGYSCMSYLKRLPIDLLKIDRSFATDIPDDKDDVAICQSIKALGESLGLRLVAEGIETEPQLEFFKNLGCDEIQGFHISRPLSEEAFTRFLLEHEKRASRGIRI
jgi:diguanylate cyclase (GGDEF)-like protein/PAS domain S-box-containing protein